MKDLKDYLQDIEPLSTYLTENKDSVYKEKGRPKNQVRIWLSYDVEKGNEEIYDNLYPLLNDLNAESWGNSVATFLVDIESDVDNESVARYLVNILQQAEVLIGDDFDDDSWKKTIGLSIYVFYRFHYKDLDNKNDKPILNSDHFVLLHNAPIKHLDGWY